MATRKDYEKHVGDAWKPTVTVKQDGEIKDLTGYVDKALVVIVQDPDDPDSEEIWRDVIDISSPATGQFQFVLEYDESKDFAPGAYYWEAKMWKDSNSGNMTTVGYGRITWLKATTTKLTT